MAFFSKFGRAFGEMNSSLKANALQAPLRWAAKHPAADGLVRWDNPRMLAQFPMLAGAVGGAAAGAGIALVDRARGRKTSYAGASAAGAGLGLAGGSAYLFGRYGGFRGAPSAFMKGWRA